MTALGWISLTLIVIAAIFFGLIRWPVDLSNADGPLKVVFLCISATCAVLAAAACAGLMLVR